VLWRSVSLFLAGIGLLAIGYRPCMEPFLRYSAKESELRSFDLGDRLLHWPPKVVGSASASVQGGCWTAWPAGRLGIQSRRSISQCFFFILPFLPWLRIGRIFPGPQPTESGSVVCMLGCSGSVTALCHRPPFELLGVGYGRASLRCVHGFPRYSCVATDDPSLGGSANAQQQQINSMSIAFGSPTFWYCRCFGILACSDQKSSASLRLRSSSAGNSDGWERPDPSVHSTYQMITYSASRSAIPLIADPIAEFDPRFPTSGSLYEP